MYRVLEVSLDKDLSQFSRLLWQRKLSHRFQEMDGRQVLLMNSPPQIQEALVLYQQWQSGAVTPASQDTSRVGDFFNAGEFANGLVRSFSRAPLTLVLIAVCCVLAVIAPLATPTALTFDLLYPDFSYGTRTIVLSQVLANFGASELVRMLTPILLHGGLVHLAFNMMWLWELGVRIERVQSSLAVAGAVVVLGLLSNTVQYLYGGGINFGGMSGVVYGLFAYIWMWQLFDPRKGLALPGSLIWFMVISLGIMTLLDLRMIANEAHLGGFMAGVIYGATTATLSRVLRAVKPEVPRD